MSKAIKFKNNVYLDSSGVTHKNVQLSSILGRGTLSFKDGEITDFNSDKAYTPGFYTIGNNTIGHAPYSGYIYGVLMVITNDGGIWRKTASDSWLWQILFTTGGAIWHRHGINSTVPEGWKQLH